MKKYFIIMIVLFFVAGCDDDTVNDNTIVYCDDPVFLDEKPSEFDGYLIILKPEVDFNSELSILQGIYDFELLYPPIERFRCFTADMSEDTLEQIRCEETIESIEYNAIGHVVSP